MSGVSPPSGPGVSCRSALDVRAAGDGITSPAAPALPGAPDRLSQVPSSPEPAALARALLSHLPPASARALEAAGGLEALAAGMVEAGREAWAEVKLAPEVFLAHVAQRLPEKDPDRALASLHAADLYLACGCAQGDPGAIAAFDKKFLGRLPEVLRKIDPAGALWEEVTQRVREKLFLPRPGGPPRIADYGGRGPLLTWVRAAAVRTATDLRRLEKDQVPLDEVEPFAAQLHSADPELEYIKGKHRDDFRAAFEQALESLTPQQRNVLRLYLLDGLNIAAIGQLYDTHRSTVARWIVDAREVLLTETRRILGERLRLSVPELESLMGLVRSRLDVSITTFLRKDGGR